MAPTLVTACTALPPKGERFALGRPGGKTMAPTLVTACTTLPPKGAECRGSMPARAGMDGTRRRCVTRRRGLQGRFALGRPGGKTMAPTLVTACTALPPVGAFAPWGGPAVLMAPTLVTARTALPPEGMRFALGRPGGKTMAPTLVTACTALPPEGACFALGRPGGKTMAPTLVKALAVLSNGKR